MNNLVYGIIPARYDSSRFPGKPLADILGKPMFWHVFQRARLARNPENRAEPLFQKVVLATDDQRIFKTAEYLHVPCLMTSSKHPSGTDRVYEAAKKLCVKNESIIVNIQGDEPALDPYMLEELVQSFADSHVRVSSLARFIDQERAPSPNQVKVVLATNGDALYFSRSVIPCAKNALAEKNFLGHIGLYAFRMEALEKFVTLAPSYLEKVEGLEQLRFLENGIPIRMTITNRRSHGVDTPQDIEIVRKLLEK